MKFSKTLINWYLENKRDLPWRSEKDAYYIWLSEIILQQTRIEQGKPYYLKFVDRFPSVFDLAAASEEEVLKLWQGLGYYSRARNLHASAKYIVNELKGIFPETYKDLLQLKGVGDYTASAIASICYEEPVAVVDGNVYRVLSRIFGISTPINSTEGIKEFKILAQKLLDKTNPSDFNQGLMEFGALQCKPQLPECPTCPFSGNCIAYKEQRIAQLPIKLRKQKIRKRHFNYLVFISEDKETLLKQRKGKGIWQGLYEFPLVETSGETSFENLVKEEEYQSYSTSENTSVALFNELPVVHKLSHQHIFTRFWIVNCRELPQGGVPLEKINEFPVPVLIDKFIESYCF
ncbi:A/G-specific adenine glycosylase [Salinimicrobium marinum]|uniref:Adenine DNA glycosylase n=1 Tax=Salinimicrobium marinum TaxID=680283 RepID=A0A918SIS5_9FLAO|nr:A/G-specific adenine glycosylase [Salinimicrobium marinum]GHA45062.1 A/G-specific adenine glycosylase [Salinimicrobium marinum]